MTKDETRSLLERMHEMCRSLPRDERGLMWDAVITSLMADVASAWQGHPPSEWFDKVAGAAMLDAATSLEKRPSLDFGPVMTATKPGEA